MNAAETHPSSPRGAALRAAFARHRFALALIVAAATTLFLAPLIRGEVFALRDHFDYFQPLRWFTAEELRAGRLPLWNPYSASGEPWFANPQTGVFYPPAWLFLVLPFATAYMLHLLAHLVLLGSGSYLLFQRSVARGAALAGAVAVMFSGPVLSLLDVSNNFCTLAWMPLALWCAAERAWKRGGTVLAMAFLAGEPFFAAFAAVAFAVVALAGAARGERGEAVRGVALSAVIAFGLSAVQLLPFLEFVAQSDRTGSMSDALILRDSMPLRDWLRVAVPRSGGTAFDPTLGQHFIPIVYAGVVVAGLALLGLTTIARRPETRGWLLLLGLSIAVSTGPQLLTQLPLTIFRYPARLVPVGAIAIAALAAIGWDRIRRDRRWLDLVLVLVIVADLLPRATPLLGVQPFRTDVVPYDREIGASGKILKFGEPDVRNRTAWISGYLNLYERRFDTFTAAPLATASYVRFYRELVESPTFHEYATAAIAHIVSTYELPEPWHLVAHAGEVGVYRNPQAWPMAALFTRGVASMRYAQWELDTSSARIVVNAPRAGLLVLRQQAAPGWEVEVDGKRAQPLVIDGVFRGVEVNEGRHEVVWRYRPWTFTAGGIMTIVTLLSLQIRLFVKHRR
jgi:hypothetical protein